MATFTKELAANGKTFKKNRLYIASAFEQKNPKTKSDGYAVSFGIANDLATPETVITDPMLVYTPYEKDGVKKTSNAQNISKKQYESILAVCNTDGDKPVFEADLMPESKRGLIPNTDKLYPKPEVPFDKALSDEKLLAARAVKKAARDAKRAEASKEADVEPELEP